MQREAPGPLPQSMGLSGSPTAAAGAAAGSSGERHAASGAGLAGLHHTTAALPQLRCHILRYNFCRVGH